MRFLLTSILVLASFVQGAEKVPTGPDAGSTIPEFTAVDQSGRTRKLADLTGPKGLMLVFFRSADW